MINYLNIFVTKLQIKLTQTKAVKFNISLYFYLNKFIYAKPKPRS